jgi:hypothetical protein
MLSLGNFYFTYHGGAKADSQLKESYKFFYHVLADNPHNAFAANGLGMVCAKKLELDAARETFSKARESNVAMSEVRLCCPGGAHSVGIPFITSSSFSCFSCRISARTLRTCT